MDNIIHDVAARLSLNEKGVSAVIKLLDEGATVPFISRYRKEATGALDEVAVRSVETTLKSVRELYTRKEFVADAITAAGAMTAKLEESLRNARSMTEVEDIYAPFKPKKGLAQQSPANGDLNRLPESLWQATRRILSARQKDSPETRTCVVRKMLWLERATLLQNGLPNQPVSAT